MVEKNGLSSASVRQWAEQASDSLRNALTDLDFELPALVSAAPSIEATPPLTNSAGKSRALSKHQKRQAKLAKRKMIIEKIRPKIELSQMMRKKHEDAIQTTTGVTGAMSMSRSIGTPSRTEPPQSSMALAIWKGASGESRLTAVKSERCTVMTVSESVAAVRQGMRVIEPKIN